MTNNFQQRTQNPELTLYVENKVPSQTPHPTIVQTRFSGIIIRITAYVDLDTQWFPHHVRTRTTPTVPTEAIIDIHSPESWMDSDFFDEHFPNVPALWTNRQVLTLYEDGRTYLTWV